MVKTLARTRRAKLTIPKAVNIREYLPGEFDADTDEERSVAVLAQRHRQMRTGTGSAGLLVRESRSD